MSSVDLPRHQRLLLDAINNGVHDNKNIPAAAAQSIDFAILSLAVEGYVPPKKLVQIYPDPEKLKQHITATKDDQKLLGNESFANLLDRLLVYDFATLLSS